MIVTLKLFAGLNRLLKTTKSNLVDIVEIGPDSTVGGVIHEYGIEERLCHLVLLNGLFIPTGERATTCIKDGDVLSIWPPVGGG